MELIKSDTDRIKGVKTPTGTWIFHIPHTGPFLGLRGHKKRTVGEWEWKGGVPTSAENAEHSIFVPVERTIEMGPRGEKVTDYYYFGNPDQLLQEDYPAGKIPAEVFEPEWDIPTRFLKITATGDSNKTTWIPIILREEDIAKFPEGSGRRIAAENARAERNALYDQARAAQAAVNKRWGVGGSRKRHPKKLRKRKTRRARR